MPQMFKWKYPLADRLLLFIWNMVTGRIPPKCSSGTYTRDGSLQMFKWNMDAWQGLQMFKWNMDTY